MPSAKTGPDQEHALEALWRKRGFSRSRFRPMVHYIAMALPKPLPGGRSYDRLSISLPGHHHGVGIARSPPLRVETGIIDSELERPHKSLLPNLSFIEAVCDVMCGGSSRHLRIEHTYD